MEERKKRSSEVNFVQLPSIRSHTLSRYIEHPLHPSCTAPLFPPPPLPPPATFPSVSLRGTIAASARLGEGGRAAEVDQKNLHYLWTQLTPILQLLPFLWPPFPPCSLLFPPLHPSHLFLRPSRTLIQSPCASLPNAKRARSAPGPSPPFSSLSSPLSPSFSLSKRTDPLLLIDRIGCGLHIPLAMSGVQEQDKCVCEGDARKPLPATEAPPYVPSA